MTTETAFCENVDWLQHVEGNLYKVKTDRIISDDLKIDLHKDGKVPKKLNPRLAICLFGGKVNQVPGLSKQDMEETTEDVRQNGLNHPILCRFVNANNRSMLDPFDMDPKEAEDSLAIERVDGARRLAILQKLIKSKSKCYDNATRKKDQPADKVHEWTLVRIEVMDEAEANRRAYEGNEHSVPIGEGNELANFYLWRKQWDYDDKACFAASGRLGNTTDKQWLRKLDILVSLDEKTFKALVNGDITREFGETLSKIKDVATRHDRLKKAIAAAKDRAEAVQKEIEDLILDATDAEELADSIAQDAESQGDTKTAAEAKAAKKKAGKKKKRAQTRAESPRRTAANSRDGNEGPKVLTKAKIEKGWLFSLKETEKTEKQEPSGDIDPNDLKLAIKLCRSILAEVKEQDIIRILKAHQKAKK